MINTEKNLKFRKLFDSSTIVQIPVIYDALSALLAQRAGFELVAMGGNGLSRYGVCHRDRYG